MQEYFGNLSILISYLKYVENLFNLLKIFLSKRINIKFFKVWTKVRRSCFNSVTVHFLWIPVTGFLTEQYTRWNLLLDWIEHFSSTKYGSWLDGTPLNLNTVSVWHLSVCVWPVMSNSLQFMDCSLSGCPCPWNFPGRSPGSGLHSRGSPSPGLNQSLLHLLH